MTTDDTASEHRTANQSTRLLLDGVSRDDLTTEFLTTVHSAADEENLSVESISVGHR